MPWSPASTFLLASALVQGAVAAQVWRRWRAPFTFPLAGLLVATAIYTGGFAFEVATARVDLLHWIVAFEYLGIAFLPAFLLLTATGLTGWTWWDRREVRAVLYGISALCALAKFTDPWHQLVYGQLGTQPQYGLTVILFTPGPLYWAVIGYLNFAQLTALVAIGRVWPEASPLLRRQLKVALVTFSLPWAAHLLYLTGASPFGRLDLVPFLFPPAIVFFTWAVLHNHFADIGPIARNVLVETLHTGVLVCDARRRVVDANPTARRQLHLGARDRLAEPLAAVLREFPALAALCAGSEEAHAEIRPGPAADAYWQANWQPLHAPNGELRGHLLTLADISVSKRQQHQLQALLAERTREWKRATAAALQAGEEEQDRIGRELHDTLCPDLIGIGRHARSLAEKARDLPPEIRAGLERIAIQAAAATRCARDLSHLLARSDFDHAPFEDLLHALVEHLEASLGLSCELTVDADFPPPDPETGRHLLRITREAVTNAARHAHAKRVWIDCLNNPGGASISFANDGYPPPAAAERQEGLGLRQMRMRAALIGAELTLEAGKSEGGVLTLRFPPSASPSAPLPP